MGMGMKRAQKQIKREIARGCGLPLKDKKPYPSQDIGYENQAPGPGSRACVYFSR